MIKVASTNRLRIDRFVEFGAYLDDGDRGILLPNRFLPKGVDVGEELDVFIYHDSEDKIIATTQQPKVQLGEIAYLKCVSNTHQGSFMDWGLMKDLFVPKSKEHETFYAGQYYFVSPYIDERTGRVAATSKIDHMINNDDLTVAVKEPVKLLVYRESDLGYVCIVNHKHEAVLHRSDVFRKLYVGDTYDGYVKQIFEGTNNIDVMLGKVGFEKISDEATKILSMLEDNNGHLPYHDKTDPETIYEVFGMSKKAFKMTIGTLYREKKIELVDGGIKLV